MRGYASFLDNTELIYPSPDVLFEKQGREGAEPWIVRQDWQLRRNKSAYPAPGSSTTLDCTHPLPPRTFAPV